MATGSTPDVVGISVEPKADTNKLIPAAAYSDLIAERCVSFKQAHACAFEIVKIHSTDKRRNQLHYPMGLRAGEMRGSYASLVPGNRRMEYAQSIKSLLIENGVMSTKEHRDSRTLIIEGDGGDEKPIPKSE